MRAKRPSGRLCVVRPRLAVLSVVTAALAVAACSSSGSSGGGTSASGGGSSGGPIKVALIAPFSGPESYLGSTTQDGLTLALKQVGGKADGRPIQVTTFDDQCTPTNAIQIVQKIISAGNYAAVFGPACSGSFIATQPLLTRAGIPDVTDSYASTVTQQGDKYVIQGVENNAQTAQALLPYITSQHPVSVGIMAGDDGYDADMAKMMKDQLTKAGIKVSYQTAFDDSATNWSGQVAGFKNSGASLLFLTAYEAATGSIVKQFRQEGVTVPIVAPLACDPEAVQSGGSLLTDTAFALNYCPTYPAFAHFTSLYESEFKNQPVDVSAGAYVTGLALFEGLQASKGQGGNALMTAIHNLNIPTPAGPLSFTSEGALKQADVITGVMMQGKATFQEFK